jgi:hypothetical protein
LLDRRQRVLDTLQSIKSCYVKLMLLKSYEIDACAEGNYEYLYELAGQERALVEDINTYMKFIVPDLVYFKRESEIGAVLSEIDVMHEKVIRDSIDIRQNLSTCITLTRKKLDNLNVVTVPVPRPSAIDIRA